MLKLCEMLRNARIKFEWNIFTNSTGYKSPCEEMHFWKPRDDIWDYLADADYTVLLSDSEGLPYTVQESLQYKVPCIVTDVGGCTELIKDGVNGYVVPLDMNFDVRKLLKIPVCKEYDNHSLEDWLKYLGYKGKIDKQKIIDNFEEEKENMVRVRCIYEPFYDDVELKRRVMKGEEFEVEESRAEYLAQNKAVIILEEPKKDISPKDTKAESENVIPLEDKKELEKLGEAIKKHIMPKKKTSKK